VRLGVDVGGTFTDLVALHDDGRIEVRKVATTPKDPAVGLFRAVDEHGQRAAGDGQRAIAALVHGTTIATNALLERRGARIALVATAGFEDLLWLRRQDRADLYDLSRDHPPPLLARDHVIGARERMGPDGVLVALTDVEMRRVVAAVAALGMKTSFGALAKVGWRPVALIVLETAWIAAIVLVATLVWR